MTLSAADFERMDRLIREHPGAVRYPPETIVLLKTLLLFPQISIAVISEMTGISPSTIKRTKAGELHVRMKPSRMMAEQIAARFGYPMPDLDP